MKKTWEDGIRCGFILSSLVATLLFAGANYADIFLIVFETKFI